MKRYLSLTLVALTVLLGSTSYASAQEAAAASSNSSSDSLSRDIEAIKELLLKHYQPMIPVANNRPLVKARFEPIAFNGCDLRWNLTAALGKGNSYLLDVGLSLADIDPGSITITMDLKRENRWFISMQTLNAVPKIKVKNSNLSGRKVTGARTFLSPQVGFDTDGQENAQKLADTLGSAIKQCSQR